AACAESKRSDMKLQNTETTNRLNTLSQTKNSATLSASEKARRFAAKKPYTTGNSFARGKRRHSQPNAGTSASITTNVAVKSHCSVAVPASTASASRTGRRM